MSRLALGHRTAVVAPGIDADELLADVTADPDKDDRMVEENLDR